MPIDDGISQLAAGIGITSATGKRKRNEDFAAAIFGTTLPRPRADVVAAIADGIGGTRGGRVAAETAVRQFLEAWCDLPETVEVRRGAARIINAINRWLHSQGRQDPELAGMGCTFTALVLRSRSAHVLHVGDTRAYRYDGSRLTRLTSDHTRDSPGSPRLLKRALGIEAEVRLDYTRQPIALHDRLLLCSDGVHGFLSDDTIADILKVRSAPEDTSRALVSAALDADSTDNCTALMLDVVRLPTMESTDSIGQVFKELPVIPVPHDGETIDGFTLKVPISDGRFSRLYGAIDDIEGGQVTLKFPKPKAAAVETYRAAFIREAWIGTQIHNPGVAHVIELPPGRQTCLYNVMPLYEGELLETRIGRRPALGLEEGRNIAVRLARAVASLHRAGIIHRDIKPDNVMLERSGSLKLLDLGAARVPSFEDVPPVEIPGTPAYMAPEMFAGNPGDEATDIYALGVTMFKAFTGEFPYGNPDATSPPRLDRPKDLSTLRPDLPAWVQTTLEQAIAANPADRYADMIAFAQEMESGPTRTPQISRRPRTWYERDPVQFWQVVSALLALALLWQLVAH